MKSRYFDLTILAVMVTTLLAMIGLTGCGGDDHQVAAPAQQPVVIGDVLPVNPDVNTQSVQKRPFPPALQASFRNLNQIDTSSMPSTDLIFSEFTGDGQSGDRRKLNDVGRSNLRQITRRCDIQPGSETMQQTNAATMTHNRTQSISGHRCPVQITTTASKSYETRSNITATSPAGSYVTTGQWTESTVIRDPRMKMHVVGVASDFTRRETVSHADVVTRGDVMVSGRAFSTATVSGSWTTINGSKIGFNSKFEHLKRFGQSRRGPSVAVQGVATWNFPEGPVVLAVKMDQDRPRLFLNGDRISSRQLRGEFGVDIKDLVDLENAE